MVINRTDGQFQIAYWLDASRVENEPDDVEYSDFLMELKERLNKVFREGHFKYAAIFSWNSVTGEWELVDEYAHLNALPKSG